MKILVVGELCEDNFIYCTADRICPEAPVPILNPIDTVSNMGMAGNVYQKNILEARFNEWIGDYIQVDDICIIGVRV